MAEFPVTRIALENRIRRLLEENPQSTTLASGVDATTSMVSVTDVTNIKAQTRIELDEELMLVTDASSSLTVLRGYDGTTGAVHATGATVRIDPRFSKANIIEAINVSLNNWLSKHMPRLVWDGSTAGTFSSNRFIYAAPAEAIGVRRVGFITPGYSDLTFIPHGPLQTYPTSIVSTGRGVPIYPGMAGGAPMWGRTVQMLVEQPWATLDGDGSQVEADFPPQADELIVKGAILYLLGFRLLPRIKLDEAVFAREIGENVPANFNLQWVQMLQNDWVAGVQGSASQRPIESSPRKVFIS